MSFLDRIARILGYHTSADMAACVKAAEDAASKTPDPQPSSISNSENKYNPIPKEPIPEHHHRYFFSYSYSSCQCQSGFGCVEIGTENIIQNFEHIESITKVISDTLKNKGIQNPHVVVLNWQLMRKAKGDHVSSIAPLSPNDLLQRIA